MFVEKLLPSPRERLVTVADDAPAMEAGRGGVTAASMVMSSDLVLCSPDRGCRMSGRE